MPKVIVGTNSDARIRIEVNYEDYKEWEAILGDKATEAISDAGDHYWKTLHILIGKTDYRIAGPVMIREGACE